MNLRDHSAVKQLLPESVIGTIGSIVPIRLGLSGADVYAVSSANGEFVLRVQGESLDDTFWSQHLLILRRAAEHGVAPPVVHVDERARAIVSAKINGAPLPTVLADPAVRVRAISDVVTRLRALHTLDARRVAERDAVRYLRTVWNAQSQRPDFPRWAVPIDAVYTRLEAVLANDPRRVISHNDVNPGNVLWDGTRSWLVDWEVAGLGHPYYDLAAFVTFLNLDAEAAYRLLELQEQAPMGDRDRATLDALRQLVALLVGNIFLSMVTDLAQLGAPTKADAPTLMECRAAMRVGEMDLQTPRGQGMFGLAFLRVGIGA